MNALPPFRLGCRLLDLVYGFRIHRVHQAVPHLARCIADDHQDGNANDKTNRGICPRETERYANHADQHCQGGIAIYACVQSVRNQRGGINLYTLARRFCQSARRKLIQVINVERLFQLGNLVHDLLKAILTEQFVLLFFKLLSQRIIFTARHEFAQRGK